jgi:ribonucleoside-diphosphate reductase alpha chain
MLDSRQVGEGRGVSTLDELANYIFYSKYARYNEQENRRETWDEAVSRVEAMHLKKYSHLPEGYLNTIKTAFNYVRDKRVVPSMRSMQFGGKAVEAHNARIYNCAVRHVDSVRGFAEIFYLLLCGCGVGMGLSNKYLSRLPDLIDYRDERYDYTYTVQDTIEGWADSVEILLNSYLTNNALSGARITFDYSLIRPEGTPLKTGGGKAPGHQGLEQSLEKIRALLESIISEQGVRIKTIHAFDIACHMADAVLAGGVRRAALSTVFQKDDEDMMEAKVGNWSKTNPQRARSNNSVLLVRNSATKEDFSDVIVRSRQWGEPGFVFAENEDTLFNPCFEISFIPVTDVGECGVQFCNLTSINGSKINTPEDFIDATWAATVIGTLQAGFTDFNYLSPVAKELTQREALLGVSITAVMDNPQVLLDPQLQREAARLAIQVNKFWAEKLGINPAARVTCIKPEGTSTLALGSVAHGIHPSHAPLMFRRVEANRLEPVYQHFRQFNLHATEPSTRSAMGTDDIITFPIIVPEGAMVKSDLTAIEHLEIIKSTQQNWVLPGTALPYKGLTHNTSCTIVVKETEWDEVTQYLFNNRRYFSAVSLLAATGDKDYQQAPMEAVTTLDDLAYFEYLLKNFKPVDYTQLVEMTDNTKLMEAAICAGGSCELVFA